MKSNGDYELSDVPALLERGGVRDLLSARSGLVNAAGDLLSKSTSENRALTGDERRRFDLHTEQIRDLTSQLAERKREKIADLAAQGLPAEYCRYPF
jgi:hypothetical protein